MTSETTPTVGIRPATVGERVTSRILTGVIGVAVVMLPYLVMAGSYAVYEAVGWNESMYLLVLLLALGVNIGYLAWILVLLFSRGQTVGQRLVGLYTRDAITREKATGKLFVKLLLQGAIASVTAGIVEPLVSLLSHRDGQTWFDTTCGTMVYKAASLSSFDAARHPVVVPAKPAIAMVSLDGLPVDHAPVGQRGVARPEALNSQPTPPPPPAPHVPQASLASAQPRLDWPEAAPAMPMPPVASPSAPVAPEAPVISGVPFSRAAPPTGAKPVAANLRGAIPGPAASPTGSAATPSVDRTVLAEPAAGATLVFDDGLAVPIVGSLVLGRDPVVPASHPTAQPLAVADPAMRSSKTHLVVEARGQVFEITDLGSTNGVSMTLADGASRRLVPFEATVLPQGAKAHLGGRWFEVRP